MRPTFTWRTATDHDLMARHFTPVNGVPVLDLPGVSICTGIPLGELELRRGHGRVYLSAVEVDRCTARTDLVRVKLGREPSVFDTLRELGDEMLADGHLTGGARR